MLDHLRSLHQRPLTLPSKLGALLSREPSFGSPYFRTRFSQSERVEVPLLVEVGQGVIDEAMGGFVRSDGANDI